MEGLRFKHILLGRVSRDMERRGVDLGVGGETRVGLYRLPKIEETRQMTHFVLVFEAEVRGVAEIRAKCAVLGNQGIDMADFVSQGQGDVYVQHLHQVMGTELESMGIVDSSGDVDMARARKVDVIGGDSSFQEWQRDKEEYKTMKSHGEARVLINWELEEEQLKKKKRQGKGKGPTLFKVRICFVLDSVLGTRGMRIVRNGDPCVAAISIHTPPGSSCTLVEEDEEIFHGRW